MFRVAIFLLPFAAFAQSVPPVVDQALRARVTEFLQYHVDGNFRKAYDLVAEDTKDHYFGAQKTKYNSFKIDEIKYLDDFTKATVKITAEYNLSIQGQVIPVTNSATLDWRVENGKWVWHYDPKTIADTPVGWSDYSAAAKAGANPPPPPKLTNEALSEQAHEILSQSGVDKSEVLLAGDKTSSDQVIFHNAFPGSVQVVLDPGEKRPGFHADLDKSDVGANGNAVLKLRYDPAEDPSGQTPGSAVHLRLTVEPFERAFAIAVRVSSPSK